MLLKPTALREPKLCKECKAQINEICFCAECDGKVYTPDYCHVCLEMYNVCSSRTYWTDLSNAWKREQADRKKRMGLEGDIG